MNADEVIAKSLDSIGRKEDRAKMTNITAIGEVEYRQSSATALPLTGQFAFATEGNKLVMAMNFPSAMYPSERVNFDGEKHNVAFARPGVRTALGDFLWRNAAIVKGGLLGGVLSKGWCLADLSAANAKVSFDGTKKIDGREVYIIGYSPKKGADYTTKLYFDKETFRHVRTEYFRAISALMSGNPNTSAGQVDNHESLIEDFSDFKTEYGVTMPRTYKLWIRVERGPGVIENFYTATLKDFYYNSKLEANTFTGDAK
jgi:hypothetical protein